MTVTDAQRLHADALIVDAVCPEEHWRAHGGTWLAGGVTACVVTAASTHTAREALSNLAGRHALIRARPGELRLATSVADIRAAKRDGETAVVLHFQGAEAVEYEPTLLEAYWRLGVRIVQLGYNRRNPLCDGCEEPGNAGLSALGRAAVAEMNRLGIVVDVSHTGLRSSLDAVEVSSAPVIASHSNAAAVHANMRNLSDELIRALAASGGVIGANAFPSFVSAAPEPTLDELIDHMAYIADLVGVEHVGLGLDYYDTTRASWEARVADGWWSPANYPPPPWSYPSGIQDASTLGRLTERLLERDFGEQAVRGILGENWLRVYGEVWGDGPR
jgi:membrane dipeptidase